MDEELIKNRLAVDERPLKNLMSRYMKWAKSLDESPLNEAQANYQYLLAQLATFELTLLRHQLIHQMNEREIGHFTSERERIEQEQVEAKKDITELNMKLEDAKEVRQNKLAYDQLAKEVNKHPSREDSILKIDEVRSEITKLQSQKVILMQTRVQRQKQFHTVITAVHELQDAIAEDKENQSGHIMWLNPSYDDDDGQRDGDTPNIGRGGETPLMVNDARSPGMEHGIKERELSRLRMEVLEDGETEEGAVEEEPGESQTNENGEMMQVS